MSSIKQFAVGIDKKGLELISESDDFTPDTEHKLRVATKRLRGLWKLAEPDIGKKKAKKLQKRLKYSSKTLASKRDHHVMLKTINRLRRFARSKGELKALKRAEKLIEKRPPQNELGPKERREIWLETLKTDRKAWKATDSLDTPAVLAERLTATYGKAYEHSNRAWTSKDIEDFHRWRRWCKYLFYQLEPLKSEGSDLILQYSRRLKSLGRWLGRRQDLAVLEETLEKGGKDFEKHRKKLKRVIRRADREAVRKCSKLSTHLFKSNPDSFKESFQPELNGKR